MSDDDRCHVTSKRKFTSAKSARRALRHAGNRVRVYTCPYCHSLHVTSETIPDRKRT